MTDRDFERELEEARAQIAAREEEFNAALTDLGNENLDLKEQIAAKDAEILALLEDIAELDDMGALPPSVALKEARAQIAAKDAALREARNYLAMHAYGRAIEAIDEALAAPARETE